MKKVITLHKRQQGYTLIIAIVLMLVMAFAAVAAIQTSGMDASINNQTLSRAQALQAAKGAINHCRTQLLTDKTLVKVIADTGVDGVSWMNSASWEPSNTNLNTLNTVPIFSTVQTSQIASTAPPPVCLIENVTTFTQDSSGPDPAGNNKDLVAYKITARGYSPNYTQDGSGTQLSGSQVWLQSVVIRMTI